jgi:hypothetical protein
MAQNNDSYVGDYFTLNFLKGDKDLSVLNDQRVLLLGFKKAIKPIFQHQVNVLTKVPGFYETLGDPLVKLDTGLVIQVPFINLIPENYRFTDRLNKNDLYLKEIRKFKFVADLPNIPYNIGDRVLVAEHELVNEDFISEIFDINIRNMRVYYLVSPGDKVLEVRSNTVIDIIDRGSLTELDRLGSLYRPYKTLPKARLMQFGYDNPDYEPHME